MCPHTTTLSYHCDVSLFETQRTWKPACTHIKQKSVNLLPGLTYIVQILMQPISRVSIFYFLFLIWSSRRGRNLGPLHCRQLRDIYLITTATHFTYSILNLKFRTRKKSRAATLPTASLRLFTTATYFTCFTPGRGRNLEPRHSRQLRADVAEAPLQRNLLCGICVYMYIFLVYVCMYKHVYIFTYTYIHSFAQM